MYSKIIFIIIFSLPAFCFSQQQSEINDSLSDFMLKAEGFYSNYDFDSSLFYFYKIDKEISPTANQDIYFDNIFRIINCLILKGESDLAIIEINKVNSLYQQPKFKNKKQELTLLFLDGLAKFKKGQYDLAQIGFSNCLEILNEVQNDSLRTLVLKNLGNIELIKRNYSDALSFYNQAINVELNRSGKITSELGVIYMNIGSVYKNLNDFDSANFWLQKSISVLEINERDQLLLAASYSNYGKFLINIGESRKALEYVVRAEEIYINKYDESFYKLGFIYQSYAKMYLLNNDFQKAIHFYNRAKNIFRKYQSENSKTLEIINSNIAVSYKNSGNFKQALNIYFTNNLLETGNLYSKIIRLRNVGVCFLHTGNLNESQKYFEASLEISKEYLGEYHIQTASSNLAYANYYSEIEDKKNTFECLDYALNCFIDFYGEGNREVANLYVIYGVHHLDFKEYLKAAQKAQQAVISITPNFEDTSIFANPAFDLLPNDYHAIAALAVKSKALSELMILYPNNEQYAIKALETGLLGIRLFETFKAALGEENSQIRSAEKVSILYSSVIKAAWQVYEKTGESKYLDQAFQIAEKNKASVLAYGMNKLTIGLGNYVPDSLLQKEKNIKQEMRTYNSLIYEEEKKNNQDTVKIEWWQNKVFNKNKELDSLMDYLAANHQKYFDLKNNQTVSSISDVQDGLHQHEVLIEYSLASDYLFVFAITKEDVQMHSVILDNNLQELVEKYLKILHVPPSFNRTPKEVIMEYCNISYSLYQLLIKPIEAFIKNKELIIIPDDVLGYLPFESLISAPYNESFTNFRKLPYLIKDFAISYHYSSTLNFNQTEQSSFFWNSNKALVIAPIYKIESRPGDSSLYDSLSWLKFTRDEAKMIYEMKGGKLFLDSLSTENNFKKYASNYPILHLAMHTQLDDDDPMSSKLIFSRSNDSVEDGFLKTYEIYDLKLNAGLVVLSACETGTGKLRKGEGIMSVARGFIFAGVPSLLISHWKINDAPSAPIMEGFYRNLGLGKRKALQKSKLDYIANSNQLFSHPYYWSAYVIIGDDSPIGDKKYMNYLITFFLFTAIVIVIYIVIRRKRRENLLQIF